MFQIIFWHMDANLLFIVQQHQKYYVVAMSFCLSFMTIMQRLQIHNIFFLEHAGELRIIILRRKKGA